MHLHSSAHPHSASEDQKSCALVPAFAFGAAPPRPSGLIRFPSLAVAAEAAGDLYQELRPSADRYSETPLPVAHEGGALGVMGHKGET